jgi:hypothetical protein
MELTISFIEPYLKLYSPKRRESYDAYLKAYEQHEWHFDGTFPEKLIKRKRPSEDSQILEYREASFQPMTKPTATKVFTSLQKIRKSPDWNITIGKEIPKIATGEDIFTYMYEKYPVFESIERWCFNAYLRNYLMDAGAICVTVPLNLFKPDNEYFKPYTKIIECEYVYAYKANEYFIWDGDEEYYFTEGKNTHKGFVVYAITETRYYRYEQTSSNGAFKVAFDYAHNLGKLPCFEVGAVIKDIENESMFYETRVAGIIPALNEAICLYSDIQAEVVQHVHSTMYSYQAQECTTCSGTGTVQNEESVSIKCNTCKGKGVFPFNPYEHVVLRPTNLGDPAAPNPPVGYIQKDTTIITILDDRFKQQLYDALSAINMEFLAERPLNQSGTAKQVDAEELNNFVYSVGEDMVHAIATSTYHCALWRYSGLGISNEDFNEMLPTVNIPTHFDIVSDSVMLDEISRMSTSKVDPTLIKAANISYARKKFSTSPEVGEQVISRMELDPLSGVSEDQILMGKQDGYILETDLIIHYNINQFTERAIEENQNWKDLTKKEKKAILLAYAKEFIVNKEVVTV